MPASDAPFVSVQLGKRSELLAKAIMPRASGRKCVVSGGQRPMLNRQSVRICEPPSRRVAAAMRGRHLLLFMNWFKAAK